MRDITIHSRLGKIRGITDGVVASFDYFQKDAGGEVRHYVLLNESVKLMFEPWKLKGPEWRDHWYIDLVKIKHLSDTAIELTDLCVDIWVKGTGPLYKFIDLEELADALSAGKITTNEIAKPLRDLQRFLDCHLNFEFATKGFPPSCIHPFMPEEHT